MNKILCWIRSHKLLTILIMIVIFILPLIVVHILFKINAIHPCLRAEWSAGDLLAYIAGFESLLGTVILGIITVNQSEIAQETNKRLSIENNNMQKTTIQPLLPILKVENVSVYDSTKYGNYHRFPVNIVVVEECVSFKEHRTNIITDINSNTSDEVYVKEVHITLKNISDSTISKISVEKIMFSSFKYAGEVVETTNCIGNDRFKFINELIMPGDSIDIAINIYFDDIRYRKFWEYHDEYSIGSFDIWLYLTNTSIAGVMFQEQIVVEKLFNCKEKVIYRAYSEEGNANT